MSKLWNDIAQQMTELGKCLRYTMGDGRETLEEAAGLVSGAKQVFITGIGASWHAGIGVQHLFHVNGLPAHLVETAELEFMWPVPPDTALIVLSRSGKSVEIVHAVEKARAANARIIGITNAAESPLAEMSDVTLECRVAFDTAASIATYTAPGLVGGMLAAASTGIAMEPTAEALHKAFSEVDGRLSEWRDEIRRSDWLPSEYPTFFLARGGSMASSYEARLLWLEVAKAASTSMTTSTFRHGPQEILANGAARIAVWLDPERSNAHDNRLISDLRKYRCATMVIGQNIEPDPRELRIALPAIAADWQFLIDIVPIQIAAEMYGEQRGFDCDRFLISSYVVESDGGL